MDLARLATPGALVDLVRLEHNADRMAQRATSLGVRLRPHVKTHKCVESARIQTRDAFGGITVSTLAEAEGFAGAGFSDITYAVPIAPQLLPRCAEISAAVDTFTLILDHPISLDAVERWSRSNSVRFSVMLKVDCGLHRAGVDPSSPAAIELATRLHRSHHVDFTGILTHAGQSYRSRDRAEAAVVAAEERDVMVTFASELERHDIPVGAISVGSTPTATAVDHLEGVSEVRPGNYLFFDAFQTAIGSCALDDVAFSILTTVIGVYPASRRLVIDAGALALSKDPGPTHVNPHCGFGIVTAPADQRPIPGLRVVSLSQEHGVIQYDGELDPAIRPGTRLRIVPNHSCLAAACFERYHVLQGTTVVDEWHPIRGW